MADLLSQKFGKASPSPQYRGYRGSQKLTPAPSASPRCVAFSRRLCDSSQRNASLASSELALSASEHAVCQCLSVTPRFPPLLRRHSPRIKKFHHEDDLLHTRRPKSHAGYRQDDRSQGVLPPFPEETTSNKLENVSGVRQLRGLVWGSRTAPRLSPPLRLMPTTPPPCIAAQEAPHACRK